MCESVPLGLLHRYNLISGGNTALPVVPDLLVHEDDLQLEPDAIPREPYACPQDDCARAVED